MPVVPIYQRKSSATPVIVEVQADSRAFAAPYQALSRAGGETFKAAAQVYDATADWEGEDYANKISDIYNKTFKELSDKAPENGRGFARNYQREITRRVNTLFKDQKVSAAVQARALKKAGSVRREYDNKALQKEGALKNAFYTRVFNDSVNNITNLVTSDPNMLNEAEDRLESLLKTTRNNVDPESYVRIEKKAREDLLKATMQSMLREDPLNLKKEIEAGLWRDADPDVVNSVLNAASKKAKEEDVAQLSVIMASDPYQFRKGIVSGKTGNDQIDAILGRLEVGDRLDAWKAAVTAYNAEQTRIDRAERRYEKALDKKSRELEMTYWMTEDREARANLLVQMKSMGRVSGAAFKRMIEDQEKIDEQGRDSDDPAVFNQLFRASIDGEPVDYLSFIGENGLTRKTAVELEKMADRARSQDLTQIKAYVKAKLNVPDKLDFNNRTAQQYNEVLGEIIRRSVNGEEISTALVDKMAADIESAEERQKNLARARAQVRKDMGESYDEFIVQGQGTREIDLAKTREKLAKALEDGDLDEEDAARYNDLLRGYEEDLRRFSADGR